jgi:hypothetical protein
LRDTEKILRCIGRRELRIIPGFDGQLIEPHAERILCRLASMVDPNQKPAASLPMRRVFFSVSVR